jgi:hypothetical protein
LLAFRFLDQYAGKQAKDLSAEALAKSKKITTDEKAGKSVAPKNPLAAMPLEIYVGDYSNDVYGRINISIADRKLIVVMGPKKIKISLHHWDKDIFTANLPGYLSF